MYLIFDTETTGLPKNSKAPITDTDNWPRCVQIAWQLHDRMGKIIEHKDFLIRPSGYNIPYDSSKVHGISTELADEQGFDIQECLATFNEVLRKTKFIVGHNLDFDIKIVGSEFYRLGIESPLNSLPVLDTCTEKTASFCQISGGRFGKFKFPTLSELHKKLFGQTFGGVHNASADVEASTRCFFELIRLRKFTEKELDVDENYFNKFNEIYSKSIAFAGLKHKDLKKESLKISARLERLKNSEASEIRSEGKEKLKEIRFAHLHNHTQFSVLQSTISIEDLVESASKDNMSAVAVTDIGNIMAAFSFVSSVLKHNKRAKTQIKPIIGCEFNVCENHKNKTRKDNGYRVVFLAKNKRGYHNLVKMSSISYVDGFYYVPRIDKEIIKKYKEDIIVLTGNLYGEIPSKILNIGEKQAEEALLWWKEEFKTDFYIELARHNQEDENVVNETLLKFSKKHNIKIVATNNVYYLTKKDAEIHDILLCIKNGEKQDTPKGRGRGFRFGLPNDEYYFKSSDEMKEIFADLPDAILNIQEVIEKVEVYNLERDVLLPVFNIPEEFKNSKEYNAKDKGGENNYLRHLSYEGAKKRFGELTDALTERLDFELDTIAKTGYPGYFLIVEDFIRKAREMDVSVGPGRGSVAGSVVAYCLWITNINPLKYDLLFERFLNPERISMPDIDIDFDDEGRSRVIDYVIEKYGSNQVAQIITYGTMAGKSSIRDTARVLNLPLFEADRIAKLVPGVKLKDIFGSDKESKEKLKSLREKDKQLVIELKKIYNGDDLASETLKKATILEGSLRNIGVHACGVIITPSDISNYVPITLAKESDMYVTQFDNSVVEDAGLLKMDFLGLKTLTLIKDTVKIVKTLHGINLDPENFPLNDKKTYALFQRGETVGVFQYESLGMQKYMRSLKPTVFGDLVAINALYRPGPMEYIPSFISRKNGDEKIEYDLPEMEEYLSETYGITIYQEQVMLLSQKIASFTKGEADVLRKAMGKKQATELAKMKPKFIEQAIENGHDSKKLEKIWKDWEAFAEYAFNKSHSVCYAWIAYQTAYLKANYPAEYMASVLSNNMNDIKSVSFFTEECKRIGLQVLGPDINESYLNFSVNKNGAVRYSMAAVKGVGSSAVKEIIKEREENKSYSSIFDLVKRVNLRAVNKKSLESLVKSGAFDSFKDTHRSQYFKKDIKDITFLECAIKFGQKYQENKNSAQASLFGESSTVQFPEPSIPDCDTWGTMELLSQEKEVVGIYISAHPLDDFKFEISFCNATLRTFKKSLTKIPNHSLTFAGILTSIDHKISRAGKGWAIFTIEDYNDSYEFKIFGEDYLKFKHFLVLNSFLFIRISLQKPSMSKNGSAYSNEPRIKFIEFNLLDEIMDKMCKKLTIKLPIEKVNEETIINLESVIKNNTGGQDLNFVVLDEKERIEVSLFSRNTKVKITNEFLSTLESLQFDFKLN